MSPIQDESKLFRVLFDTILQGAVVLDMQGNIIRANPAAEHLIGLTVSHLETRNMLMPDEVKLFRPDGSPLPCAELAGVRALREGRPVRNVVAGVKHPDRPLIWLLSNAAPIHDDEGRQVGAISLFADITEQMEACQALKESEAKYRDLVENIQEVVYAVEDGVVTYISPTIERASGYSVGEVIGQTINMFLDPVELRRGLRNIQRVMAGEDISPQTYRMIAKGGEPRWVRTSSRPIVRGGEVVGVQGILVDVTDRKRMEKEYEEVIKVISQALKQLGRQSRPETNTFTRRERDVLRLVGQGLSNAEIAAELEISEKTVSNRLTAIYEKLDTNNRVQVALYALRNGYAYLGGGDDFTLIRV